MKHCYKADICFCAPPEEERHIGTRVPPHLKCMDLQLSNDDSIRAIRPDAILFDCPYHCGFEQHDTNLLSLDAKGLLEPIQEVHFDGKVDLSILRCWYRYHVLVRKLGTDILTLWSQPNE